MNTLLVEDESLDSELMTKYLRKLGCSVNSVTTGQEAIQILDSDEVDLVVCDINLADDIDGFALLKHARLKKPMEELPIILVTASHVNSEMYDQLRIDGGVDICQKWEGVIQKVRDFIQDHQRKTMVASSNSSNDTHFSFNRMKKFNWRPW